MEGIEENSAWNEIPKLANLKKGEPFDLYIGRENKWLNLPHSKWHNPFPLKNESERAAILEKYRNYIENNHELLKDLYELKGLTLGCYCKPKKCHGEVLIELYKKLVK